MRKRVIQTTIEELKNNSRHKPKSNISFTISKPAQNITPEQEREMLQSLMDNMHADRLANGQKDHYFD